MLGQFDDNEFETIEYMASSGGLSVPDSDARMAYYGIGPIPHLLFNGGNDQVGAGTDVVDGSVYAPIVLNMIGRPSPVRMGISSHSFVNPGAGVTVDLALEADLEHPAQTSLRVAVLEDGLTYGATVYDNILRDVVADQALPITLAGQAQQVTVNFTAGAGWNAANLRLVAFVQDDATREVLQVCNSHPAPAWSMRYYASGDLTRIESGLVAFGEVGLFNAGTQADTYDVSLDTSGLPAGWSATVVHGGGAATSFSVPLAADERALMHVEVTTAGTGDGEVVLTLHARDGTTPDRAIPFKVITPDVQVLLVDDDGAEKYESLYFAPAIGASGKSHAIWDRTAGAPSAAVLANFEVVVWQCGWAFPTLDETDRAALGAYLDAGGSLFVTGQDIGWEMNDTGGAALTWYHDYLHADFVADDTNTLTLQGVPGDPITDGLTVTIGGGDGANNQEYPSDIDPHDAGAAVILTYDASRNAAIRADHGDGRVVYLAFGFEAINNPTDRAAFMSSALAWLAPAGSGVADRVPGALTVRDNVPNPFNPRTLIRYRVADGGAPVALRIYDLQGRLVRTLVDRPRTAGEHGVVWDGRDDGGRALPSGTYFCRVAQGGATANLKMTLVK
ncbi:Omp28-related outer membrane protein [bacterium]|nr:Omp28-related outer membrane protein [bacterium]